MPDLPRFAAAGSAYDVRGGDRCPSVTGGAGRLKPRLIVKTRDGIDEFADAEAGRSVIDAISEAGINEWAAVYGVSCPYGACHAHVAAALIDRHSPPIAMRSSVRWKHNYSTPFSENSDFRSR